MRIGDFAKKYDMMDGEDYLIVKNSDIIAICE